MEPLAHAVLAGLTSKNIEVISIDERFETIPFDEQVDLVALSVETFAAKRAYEISKDFRERGVPVILGGFHPSLLPEEAARHADSIAIGEVESLWPQVLKDFCEKRLRPIYHDDKPPALNGIFPDRSIFKGKPYLPISLVQFGRGCLHRCEFCSVRSFYGDSYRTRPILEVVKEIEEVPHKLVFFVDDNLISNPIIAKELLIEITPLKIKWCSQASLEIADDVSTVELLKKSGCIALIIGLESLSAKNLACMNKSWNNLNNDYQRRLKVLRDHGIMVYATFVFGYDYDTPSIFEETLDFALKQRLFMVNFNLLQPYPGTLLYKRLENSGRLLYPRWWIDPSYRFGEAAFLPQNMTPKQLSDGCSRTRHAFNRVLNIFRRSLDLRANCGDFFRAGIFFATNILSRFDILAKEGLRLGRNSRDSF